MDGIPLTGPVSFLDLAVEFGFPSSNIDLLAMRPTITELDGNSNANVSIARFRGKKGRLFDFTSFTFTNAGRTGAQGPTREDLVASYSNAPWTANASFLDVPTQGFQTWSVPKDGDYAMIVAGAGTGNVSSGRGAVFTNTSGVSLKKGEKLVLIVGHQGINGAGGGGSFVYKNTVALSNLLVVSGGGGFQSSDASTSTGAFGGGTGGNGGGCTTSAGRAGGGPGANGTKGNNGTEGGGNLPGEGGYGGFAGSGWNGNMSPVNVVDANTTLQGSFGGGGPPGKDGYPGWYSGAGGGGKGGGGGYQGGGGGGGGGGGNGCWGGGGGGGTGGGGSSYTTISGSFTGLNANNGYITITRV